ncbi:MAG: C40 family peptidase [Clostridia bacterium]|nr:C40 family peptidase [Clostridia bacterium]
MQTPIIQKKTKARFLMYGDSFVASGNFGDLLVYFASLHGIELSITAVTYNNKSSGFDYTALDLCDPNCRDAETAGFAYVKKCNTEVFCGVLGDPEAADLFIMQAPRGELFGKNADPSALKDAYIRLTDKFRTAYPNGKVLFILPPVFDGRLDSGYCRKWDCVLPSRDEQRELVTAFAEELKASVPNSSILDMQGAYDLFDRQEAGFTLFEESFRHPSLMGSYYNSCVAFAHIFGISCANLGFFGALPREYALKLQNVAHKAVFGTDAPVFPLKTQMLPHREEKDPRFENETVEDIIKPLLAAAKAGFDRGAYFQYDMAALNQVVKSGSWRREMRVHPESATPQRTRYIDCSCYVHNCYHTAYGHRLEKADDTKGLIAREDLHVFYRTPSSGESAEDAYDRMIRTIRPGDAIVFRKHNEKFGHAMLYIGNGWVLHSTSHNFSGSSGNYDFGIGCDNRELVGTIRYDKLDVFAKPWGERYMFGPEDRVALLRPTEKLGLLPAQSATDRMNNLYDIVAYKLTSSPQGISVNRGGQVKFTFVIHNIGDSAKTVEIEDQVSPLLEFVSACGLKYENGKISGAVTVEGGEEKEVSYTVTVSENAPLGGIIECRSAAVGKVSTNETDIYVANTLTQTQQDAVIKAAAGAEGCLTSLALAKAAYAAMGVSLPIDSLEQVQDAVFAPCNGADTPDYFCAKNGDGAVAPMAVPCLTGGCAYYIPRSEHTDRLRQVHKGLFIPGDLLYTYSGKDRELWICTGDNRFVTVKNGVKHTAEGMEAFMMLDGVLGKKAFCVLRPSMAY